MQGHHYAQVVGYGETQIHAGDTNHFHGTAGLTLEEQCCQAFKTSNYEEYKNRNPPPVDGTCQWALGQPQFRDWRESDHEDLLWISADPGCGKSVLARSLVDRDLNHNGTSLVCYFFFKDNQLQDGLDLALCAILHQLMSQRPDLIRHVLPAWKGNGSKVQGETYEMWRILERLVTDPATPPVICVLDALDECREQDRERLISLLCGILRPGPSRNAAQLKFLVTSRPYDNVQRWFDHTTSRWPHIRLKGEDENEKIGREINLVIVQRVQELGAEFGLTPLSRERLQATLLQMQHRTYLWLYLAIDEIRETYLNSLDPDTEVIDLLPQSVEAAYERLLQRINHKQQSNARQILLIILGARRPLSIGEMACALGTAQVERARSNQVKVLNALHLEKQIRLWCGLFVFIQHSTLYLIHQTAKEFLLSKHRDTVPSPERWQGSFQSQQIEFEMLKICTMYLCLTPEGLDESEAKRRSVIHNVHATNDSVRFWQYCAEYWPRHLQFDITSKDGLVFDRILALYNDKDNLQFAWLNHFMNKSRHKPWPSAWQGNPVPSQHIAAFNGHQSILAHLYEENPFDLEMEDRDENTLLLLAVNGGCNDVVRWLVEKGVDVNAAPEFRRFPLPVASALGHMQIVQMLVAKSTNISTQPRLIDDALSAAAEHGHMEIVQLLLDKGATEYNDALLAASGRGHTTIVQLLLDRGANEYNSALLAASDSGHTEIVQLLLDKGADDHNRALPTAVEWGHTEVVQLLLDKGADVNGQIRGGSMLSVAAENNDVRMVQILVENGAVAYNEALLAASISGSTEIVQVLLEKGANPNYEGVEGTAFYWATRFGYAEIVQMFLDNGADVDAQRGEDDILWMATNLGQTKLV